MDHKYTVEILQFSTIHELEGAWSNDDYKAILEQCEFDGIEEIPEGELFDYLSLALQDYDPEDAAAIVLTHRLGDRLKKGQIQSVANDIQEENLWEEYGEMALHEELFNITSLLYSAFNGRFPHPDAIDLRMKITAATADGAVSLKSLDESLLARALALGQDDHAIINRLFDEKIAGPSFTESKDIIWKFTIEEETKDTATVHINTARYWVKGLRKNEVFEVKTHGDEV